MIEAMLEPHLTLTAGATHSEIGTTFMIAGIVYSISTPITGYVYKNLVMVTQFFPCLFINEIFLSGL